MKRGRGAGSVGSDTGALETLPRQLGGCGLQQHYECHDDNEGEDNSNSNVSVHSSIPPSGQIALATPEKTIVSRQFEQGSSVMNIVGLKFQTSVEPPR